VRDSLRAPKRVAGAELDLLARQIHRHSSLEHVEDLVLPLVDMQRRHVSGRGEAEALDDRVATVGLLAADVDTGEAVDEPERLGPFDELQIRVLSSTRLTPFSYVVLALVGRGGAGPDDLVR
jgi:hypothetical protein